MSYIREGAEFADNCVWTGGTYELGFANGDWTPTTATVGNILPTEVGDRLSVTPVLSFNTTTSRSEVEIEVTYTPTADVSFNRVFIIRDPGSQASWTISAVPVPATTVTIPGQDFALGERFVLDRTGDILTVSNIVVDDITFTGQTVTFLTTDIIRDARGTFLSGSVLSQNTIFFNGVQHFIDLKFETITA